MTQAAPTSAPKLFWAVCAFAVLFNGFGVYDWFMSLRGADYYRAAGLTEAQVAYQIGLPAWMQSVWSVGVWMAALGTVLLTVRRKQAFPVFLLALACAVISLAYQTLLSPGLAVMGPMVGMAVIIVAICGFLAWYAWRMAGRGVLG